MKQKLKNFWLDNEYSFENKRDEFNSLQKEFIEEVRIFKNFPISQKCLTITTLQKNRCDTMFAMMDAMDDEDA